MAILIGVMGANPDRRTTTREFTLGTTLVGDDKNSYTYVQADLAVPAATAAAVMSAGFHLTATTTGAYTADTAFASGEFGWVRKSATPF